MTRVATVMAQIRRHGLTATDKVRIAREQAGCAICGRLEPGGKGWVVDHDRSCCPGDQSCLDCRRGVLCQWCNNALGYAGDDPTRLRRMADYLELGTRVHPSHVWTLSRLTDQLSDQSTDAAERVSPPTPTDETDETDEENYNPPLINLSPTERATRERAEETGVAGDAFAALDSLQEAHNDRRRAELPVDLARALAERTTSERATEAAS